jgi:hypothetical protein
MHAWYCDYWWMGMETVLRVESTSSTRQWEVTVLFWR